MQSMIGSSIPASRRRLALGLALATIAAYFLIVFLRLSFDFSTSLVLFSTLVLVWLCEGDLTSLGLRWSPRQGWRLWIRWAWRILMLLGVALIIGFGVARLIGYEFPIITTPPRLAAWRFVWMCIYAPLLEELLFRFILCVPLSRFWGGWTAIAISGTLFAFVHVAYGSASPENLLGGFFLAWAYLKSESIVIPILLHATGNFLALLAQLVGWYLVHSSNTFVVL